MTWGRKTARGRWRRGVGAWATLSLVVLVCTAHPAMQESGANTVFVVDTSRSMQANGVFEQVRRMLADYVRQLRPGDHVILLGFDQEVSILADDEIATPDDIARIEGKVRELRALGQWTYMTHALDIAATQAARLQAANPKRKHLVYLFTDGKNEPPPSVPEKLAFADVLRKHFRFFASDRTFFYMLSLVQPEQDLVNFVQQIERGGGQARIVGEMPAKPELREIELEASFERANEMAWSSGRASGEIGVSVRRMINAAGTRLRPSIEIAGLPPGVTAEITPAADIVCEREGQRETLQVKLAGALPGDAYREYRARIRMNATPADVNVSPEDWVFPVTVVAQRRGFETGVMAGLVLLMVAGLGYVIAQTVRRRVRRNVSVAVDGGEPRLATAVSGQRLWLGRRETGEYVDAGLDRYYLTLSRRAALLLVDSRTRERRTVVLGQPMACDGVAGGAKVVFADAPSATPPEDREAAGSDRLPDPMRDI